MKKRQNIGVNNIQRIGLFKQNIIQEINRELMMSSSTQNNFAPDGVGGPGVAKQSPPTGKPPQVQQSASNRPTGAGQSPNLNSNGGGVGSKNPSTLNAAGASIAEVQNNGNSSRPMQNINGQIRDQESDQKLGQMGQTDSQTGFRPGSQGRIQSNSNIMSGGKSSLQIPGLSGSNKQEPSNRSIDKKQQIAAVLGNLANEDFFNQQNEIMGTQNDSPENSVLLSPQAMPSTDLKGKNMNQYTKNPTQPSGRYNNVGLGNQNSRLQSANSNAGKLSGRNKISPMPPQVPRIDERKMPFGGLGAAGYRDSQPSAKATGQDSAYNTKTPKNPLLDHSIHQEPRSLRSSFDYADVDLNNAMGVIGKPTITGRGQKFVSVKHFKEDNWSDDESIYAKQMKMPNVNANKIQYQKEIGINLNPLVHNHHIEVIEGKLNDSLEDIKKMMPEPNFYKIVNKDRIHIIEDYHDRCPLLGLRKQIMKARVYCNRGAQLIMQNSLFESISITVIVVNSIFLAMDDPLRDPSETPAYMGVADDIFQYLYTIEMVVKIVSLGFICNDGSYLRDAWNILDFVIIASGYMGMFLQGSGVNLSALRSFRVIRPLRTISSVAGLRVIVSSLINAMPLLRDSLLVLMFFFLVFAIAGCQLFTGALKNRCFYEETGVIDISYTEFCGGGNSCRPGYYCAKSNENPANGATNFDNITFALLQVFQVVSMEGWTAIMVGLMQSVGTWIVIYFYPIIFIGAFFLLNLTLAVIKAKFTEEMNNKQENAGPPKKKKLDDAPLSSEDEDAKAMEIKLRIEEITEAKNMSPRTKQNEIEKIRIGQMIKKIDRAFIKREVEHKIVEKEDEEELIHKSPNKSQFQKKSLLHQSKKLGAADKIQILNQSLKAQMATPAATIKSTTRPIPENLNYSEVFYSNKRTVLTLGNAHPGKELMDLFVANQQDVMSNTGTNFNRRTGGNFMLGNLEGGTIAEDDEEQHIEIEEINRKKRGVVRGMPQRAGNMSDIEEAARQQKKMSQTTHGPGKWLGKMFEVRQPHNNLVNEGNAEGDKRLVFAGITNQQMKNTAQNLGTSLKNTAQRFLPDQQEREENAKREIYENITKNFDIFEFLEDENAISQPVLNKQSLGTTPATYGLAAADDEMSDDLEFHIQELDRKVEAMLYQDNNDGSSGTYLTNPQNDDIDRLNNIVSRDGARQETEDGEPKNGVLKRGSTQATYDGNFGVTAKQSPHEMSEYKYVSPFMQNLRKSQLKDKTNKKKKYPKKDKYPDLVYRGNTKGLVGIFRACKKIQAVSNGRDFKQEYVMLRKRARSLVNNPPAKFEDLQEGDENAEEIMNLTQKSEKSAANAQPTIRAKSIESKRKQLLAHSIKFQKRINLMRKRRAQYFAPEIKLIEADHEALDKAYEEHVFNRRKIKINPILMDEPMLRKRVLYRSASSDPILRHNEYIDMKNALGLPAKKNKQLHIFDLHGMLQEEGGSLLDIETQRSQLLEQDYVRVVLNQEVKQKEFDRYHEHEYVPHMEDILQEKDLKIVVKMTNMRFGSINDIFEKSGPGRFMTDREKFLLEQERKKKEALKMKLPERVPPKEIILGYQKKLHYVPKNFHENLLRTEFVPSDEDQEGMLNRIEDQFNYNHRSHIYNTGTISVVVQKPHNDNKIMNWNYFANIQALERDAKYEQEMILIEEEKLAKEAQRKKPGIILYDNEKIDHKAWRTQLPTYTINANSMKLYNTSQYVYSKTFKNGYSMNTSQSEKHFDVIHPPPRPEPLTDRQILSYMNFDCKRSSIFNSVNFAKLPDKIYKRELPVEGKGIRVRKKVKDDDVKPIEVSDEEIAEKKSRKIDYFLDRKFEGAYHIDMAKNSVFKRPRDWFEWSGQDVLSKFDPYKVNLAIKMLDPIRVWPYDFHGYVKKWRIVLRKIMNGPLVEHGMTVCVLGNTVVLSLDYYGASETIEAICATANTFFTLIFAIEMFSRIIAIGAPKWLSDKMNYMDGTIVMLSLVEMIFMSGGGALSALRAVRIFRVFRVLRVARLLRGLKSMMQIINVIQRSISSFIYLAMLLLLFIFIYALLGMQVFGGAFKDPEVVGTVRYNYDSFISAFITAFILLTTENWNSVMFYAFSGDTSQALIAVYFVSCIFIGNWMLLNLFLAILLDSFTQVEEEDMMTPEKRERIRLNMLDELKIKEGEDFIEGMQDLHVWSFNVSTEKKEKKKKKKKKKKTQEEKEAEKQPVGNILDESQEVDLNELAKRDEKALAERQKLFRNIECEKSCYLLSKQNLFRILCYKIVHHGKFESFIMLLIVGSSFKLVFDTYTDELPVDDPITIYSSKIDLVFQAFFTIEMTLKIISFGFVMDENSYLQESWSQMDFFIVTTGLIDSSLEGVDIAFLKVLRLLRILRPLRFLSHSSSMKTLIEALMASIPSIMNVGVVIVIVFLMFAILGVNLFAGKLQSCTVDFYKINTMEECFKVRGSWTTFDQHMDNVVRAMITLFVVSNNEGWPDVMYAYGDATGVETGPKPGAGMGNCFFFVGFVFVGSFFFLNLFTGVLFLNFEKAQRDEADAMLLDGDEVKWVDMMKMICDEQPEIIKIPKNPIRRWAFDFTRDEGTFANFIMACIILNIFTMAATFEGQSDSYSNVLEKINYFFTAAFTLECASKLIAHGGHYFSSGWNKFDFFVVSASFLDIVMANMSANSLKVIRVGPQLARIMRVMRVSRLFKLLNKYKGLQALMSTITFSLPSVINAFALLSLVYFIFSILGVFFFKNIIQGDQIDDYMNFKDFTHSLMMMLRLSTGEDWPVVMYDLQNTEADCIPDVNCGTGYAFIFFIMFVLIQQYIMVDLFVLIILQQFDLYYLPTDNVLDRFKTDVNSFKITWKKFSADFDGFKIRGNDVQKFFKELKGDLGMSMIKDKKTVERELVIMNLQADSDGYIYFNELLYKTMKRRYANGRTKKKVLYELELDTLEKLERIMKEQMLLSRAKERKNAVAVNPFLAMMYKNMSFNVWRTIYESNLPKRIAHMQLGLEREISEEEEEIEEEGEAEYEYVTEDYEVVEEVAEQGQPQNPMVDEEESPFAFHEGGSREEVTPAFAADGVPRSRFMGRGGKNMTKRYSQEDDNNDADNDKDEDYEILGKRR